MFHRLLRAGASAAVLILAFSTTVFGHSQLTTATPGPDEEISTVPNELIADFTQNLDAGRSSMELRDAAGASIAKGANDPAEPRVMRMALPELEPGVYEVRWTTLSTEDGELARGTYAFTVVIGSPATVSPISSTRPAPSEVAPASEAPTSTGEPSSEPEVGRDTGGDEVIWPLLVLSLIVASVGVWIYRRP